MMRAVESFSEHTTSGFSAQEILLKSMSTRPEQVGVERHQDMSVDREIRYWLARDYCLRFRHMGSRIHEFAELATQMGFTRGDFTLDPDLDLEAILVTNGWTEPREFMSTWYFYQDRLRSFASHFHHVQVTLSRYQRQEERQLSGDRSPSIAPTTFTEPKQVHEALCRHMDRAGPSLEPFDEDPTPVTAWRSHTNDPPARPCPSIHIAAQGPADGWRLP